MEAPLWPWLAVAAAGALHGLNPLTGWAFAAWRAAPGAPAQRPRLLAPIAAGQVAAVLAVAAAVPLALELGLEFQPWLPQALAAALLLVLALRHFGGGRAQHGAAPAARKAIALWSFVVGIGHGAGWMLVPALASVCASDAPAREITASGSLLLGMAAVAVHLVAMLATTWAMAAGVRHVFGAAPCVSRMSVSALTAMAATSAVSSTPQMPMHTARTRPSTDLGAKSP